MERAPDGRLLVVCDTCVLINFLNVGRLDLLARHREYQFTVTEHVLAEVTDHDQSERLRAAISGGEIKQVELTDPQELWLFAELSTVLGRGEAAAISAAANRNWAIATDEGGRTRREIQTRLGHGRLLTTPGILLRAIRNSALTLSDADTIKAQLERHRFRMSFASFADLLSM